MAASAASTGSRSGALSSNAITRGPSSASASLPNALIASALPVSASASNAGTAALRRGPPGAERFRLRGLCQRGIHVRAAQTSQGLDDPLTLVVVGPFEQSEQHRHRGGISKRADGRDGRTADGRVLARSRLRDRGQRGSFAASSQSCQQGHLQVGGKSAQAFGRGLHHGAAAQQPDGRRLQHRIAAGQSGEHRCVSLVAERVDKPDEGGHANRLGLAGGGQFLQHGHVAQFQCTAQQRRDGLRLGSL